jgi:type IV pilus assembly protein PilE
MKSSKRNSPRYTGFSLIEVMIVLGIIGILSAVAFPSYQTYVTRSSRSAAQTELLQMANLQEKIYLNTTSYSVSISAAYNGRSDGGLGLTPGTTADGKYTLTITPNAIPTQTYLITATPVVGSTQDGDGAMTISSNGTRLHAGVAW